MTYFSKNIARKLFKNCKNGTESLGADNPVHFPMQRFMIEIEQIYPLFCRFISGQKSQIDYTLHTWSNLWFVWSKIININKSQCSVKKSHTHTNQNPFSLLLWGWKRAGEWLRKKQRGLCLHWQGERLVSPMEMASSHWMERKLHRDWQGLLGFEVLHNQCCLFPSLLQTLGVAAPNETNKRD